MFSLSFAFRIAMAPAAATTSRSHPAVKRSPLVGDALYFDRDIVFQVFFMCPLLYDHWCSCLQLFKIRTFCDCLCSALQVSGFASEFESILMKILSSVIFAYFYVIFVNDAVDEASIAQSCLLWSICHGSRFHLE